MGSSQHPADIAGDDDVLARGNDEDAHLRMGCTDLAVAVQMLNGVVSVVCVWSHRLLEGHQVLARVVCFGR